MDFFLFRSHFAKAVPCQIEANPNEKDKLQNDEIERLRRDFFLLANENIRSEEIKLELQGHNDYLRASLQTLNHNSSMLADENVILKKNQTNLQNEVTNLKFQITELQNKSSGLENDRDTLQDRLLNSREIMKQLTKNCASVKNDFENKSSELADSKNSLELTLQELKTKTKEADDFAGQLNQLREKVAHFAIEVLEKKRDLPTLGDNNMGDMDVSKFVNFVIQNSAQLRDLAPDGLDLSKQKPEIKTKICKLCHQEPKFARCKSDECGNYFHEQCIRRWFKTRKECPCCHNDSIQFEVGKE